LKLTDFLKHIGRPLVYYPSITNITGGVTETVFLCNLINWHGKQNDSEGWIFKSNTEIQKETGLSRQEQRTARKNLKGYHLLEEKIKGTPPVIWFRVNFVKLNILWENHISSMGSNCSLELVDLRQLKGQIERMNWLKLDNQLVDFEQLYYKEAKTTTYTKKQPDQNHHIVNNSGNGKRDKPLRAAFLEKREDACKRDMETDADAQSKLARVINALSALYGNKEVHEYLEAHIKRNIPPGVTLYVLEEIGKNRPESLWAYGQTILKRYWPEFNYQKNLAEHYRLKNAPINLKDIFRKKEA
jgi:hypothetical protein